MLEVSQMLTLFDQAIVWDYPESIQVSSSAMLAPALLGELTLQVLVTQRSQDPGGSFGFRLPGAQQSLRQEMEVHDLMRQ